jgi:hypothetical protein
MDPTKLLEPVQPEHRTSRTQSQAGLSDGTFLEEGLTSEEAKQGLQKHG